MQSKSFKATDLQEADSISVLVGVATAHCAIATTMVSGRVGCVTEKAVRVDDHGASCWFPKKALIKGAVVEVTGHRRFDLAKWFHPDVAGARAISRMSHHSVLTA